MKKTISVILSVIMIVLSFSISVYSEDALEVVANEKYFRYYEEVNNIDSISVSDARNVLLQSIGAIKNDEFVYADADSDGAVTAIDARAILRVAIKLEKPDNYFFTSKTNLFNTIINSIKPGRYNYYSTTRESIDDIVYDNAALINSINKQMNDLMSKFGGSDEELNLSDEILAEKGKVTYTGSKYSDNHTISSTNYPISENNNASLLEPKNIESFEFKTGETFKLNIKNGSGKTDTWNSTVLTGLNSITVYIKSDEVTDETDETAYSELNASKAFDILSKKDIETAIGNTGSLSGLDGMNGLEDLGARMNINMGFDKINYKNSYVKIYYNPATGNPIASEHSLHYDMKVNMDLDLYVPNIGGMITGWDVGKPYLNAAGRINITNTVTRTQYFCFHNADAAYPIEMIPANS